MRFGGVELHHGLMLAPMAGFTDRAMRVVCHGEGCEVSVTEMISAKAVVYGDKKTYKLARIMPDEGPVLLQIFGHEPDVMAEAAHRLSAPVDSSAAAPVGIDINMGCPVHKIFSNGEGSALMRSPNLIYDIVKSVSQATNLPCTVKMRLGVDRAHINVTECALAAEEAGAALLTVHGRTRAELYSGIADWETIGKVKQGLHIPVIANGDIASADDAMRALEVTGADGIAIGRGAVGNPFIFGEIIAALEGREYIPPTLKVCTELAERQLALASEEKGEEIAVREARKQIAQYFRSFRGAAELRAEINRATTVAEVIAAIEKLEK